MLVSLVTGALSYDNFYYLSQDFGVAFDYVNSGYNSITYSIGESQSFALYHGGLAVASREGISIYSAKGRELFSASHQYGNPILETSSKYALLYDGGGKQYSLYNSFSKVAEETLEYPILKASIASSGEYALLTSSDEYRSVLRVFRGDGKIFDYNFASAYVTSIAISDDGTKVAACIIDARGDSMQSEIRVYNVGSAEYKSVVTGFSGMPYEIAFLEGGGICAVSSEGVNVFSSGLKLVGEYYGENGIHSYSVSRNAVALLHFDKKMSKTKVIVFDKSTKTV